MEKFGSIEQFKNVIQSVRRHSDKFEIPIPTMKFIGTVKIHGTNAGIVVDKNQNVIFQSRERELNIGSDNAGFCAWGITQKNLFLADSEIINDDFPGFEKIAFFGEWCGPGVQKGVAVSQLPEKIFVIFNITLIDSDGNRKELNPTEIGLYAPRLDNKIFTVYDFPTWEIDIDFNAPQLIQNDLVDITLQVENECPVGKHFGITGVGEGVVFWNPETNLKFKVKGEKHSNSKVNNIKKIAAVDIERMNSINEFVDTVMTENRMNQGLTKLGEMGLDIDIKNTGAFIQWCVKDCLKEEAEVIVHSNFNVKELSGKLSAKAKSFWFANINKF